MTQDESGGLRVTPDPSSPDWSAWATLANDISAALVGNDHWTVLSVRTAIAADLWQMGYRPTATQIDAERERQNPAEAARNAPRSDWGASPSVVGRSEDSQGRCDGCDFCALDPHPGDERTGSGL